MQVCFSSQASLAPCKCAHSPPFTFPSPNFKRWSAGPSHSSQSVIQRVPEGKRRVLGLPSVRPRGPVRSSVMTSAAASPKVLIPVATGTEEMEAVIMIDVLRRAGAEVVVASVEEGLQVTCSRGVKLTADVSIAEAAKDHYDLIAMPGGMPGAERLRDCTTLEDLVKAQIEGDRLLAAICATPAVFLEAKGLLVGQKATCHPGFSSKLSDQGAVEGRVVVDGKLTTSRGPGTAFEFALSLVNQLYGREKMEEVAKPMVMYPYSV